jgi:hypothetical protein
MKSQHQDMKRRLGDNQILATDSTNFTKSELALSNSCNPWQMLLLSACGKSCPENKLFFSGSKKKLQECVLCEKHS